MQVVSAEARYIELGKDVGLGCVKLFRHPSQPKELQVKFELRRVLDELRGRGVETHTVIKESGKYWESAFQLCDGDLESAVIPSSRSWAMKHKAQPPEAVLEEYQLEAWATMCIIVQQATRGRTPESRQRALRVLRSLLSTLVIDEEDIVAVLGLGSLSVLAQQKAAECEADQGGVARHHGCQHVQNIFSEAMKHEDSAEVASQILMGCMASSCAAAKAHFRCVVETVEQHLGEVFNHIGTADPLSIDSEGRDHKRRRLDGDRKAALLGRAIHDKKSKSVKSLCSARDERGAQNSPDWMQTEVAAYQWSLWASFNGAQSLALAFDASRLGMPREESLIIAAYDSDRDIAGWLMPQVLNARDTKLG